MHNDEHPSAAECDDRRSFIGRVLHLAGCGALGMSLASTVYANFRFFFPKVLYEPPAQFQAGFPAEYQRRLSATGGRKNIKSGSFATAPALYALLTTCTHLGCLTGFFPAEKLCSNALATAAIFRCTAIR